VGYRRKIYSLKWAEGHELHGLEASLTGMSIGRLAVIQGLGGVLTGDAPVAEKLAAADELFGEAAKCLVAWNLEDHDGQPVPVTKEGIADQDVSLVLSLMQEWAQASASVDTPLPSGSNGGPKPMPEESIPMAPLSPSLPN
jgi:hypothetical protein